MNDLYATINHKKLQMTVANFEFLQQKMGLQQKLILGNYVFIAKDESTEWTHTYKAINSITRDYHFIKIYDLTKIVQDQVQIESNRIISKVKKQMTMNPQNIVKCYQLLQNQNFIMVISQYCNEGNLEDKIIDTKIHPLQQSIEWLKQVIYGLAELYTQNIYLENINPKKILLKDGSCKMADFQNLQRRLTMTEGKLVKRHLFQLGKLFARLIFGFKRIESQQIIFIIKHLKTAQKLFAVELTQNIKDFLYLTLNINQKQNLVSENKWEQTIKLKIFHDSTKSLSNKKFQALSLLFPQANFKDRIKPVKIHYPSVQQQKIQQWGKQHYIQFLKTQLILNRMIIQIDDKKSYNINDRSVLQILYLLNLRCMNNLRDIVTKKDQMKESIFIKEYEEQIDQLEKQVSKRFYRYSGNLTLKQNQKLQIGKDFFNFAKNIVTLKISEKSRRDKFLTGFQAFDQHPNDYSKEQQIQFTKECINQFLQKQKICPEQKGEVYFYLLKYKQISEIKFDDLGCQMFEKYVQKIVNEQFDRK